MAGNFIGPATGAAPVPDRHRSRPRLLRIIPSGPGVIATARPAIRATATVAAARTDRRGVDRRLRRAGPTRDYRTLLGRSRRRARPGWLPLTVSGTRHCPTSDCVSRPIRCGAGAGSPDRCRALRELTPGSCAGAGAVDPAGRCFRVKGGEAVANRLDAIVGVDEEDDEGGGDGARAGG